MSTRRPPAAPPEIAGFRYVSLLGSGGFSDVYLYEQDRPRRQVAVKVLLSDLKTESARRRFESEANLMAQLSSHPYIVTIYEADVTPDGHSYLAMEYCSRPSLDVRYRRSRLGADEVLSVGIQVASAVETAHRAGIVHRDIKPANILVTDYNRPALTDFGISGTTDALDDEAGLSIPWSPPEAFSGGTPSGVRMDVWSLGATLYTLLAGRSPFVRPGADNSQRELINRIANTPLPPLHRADVPPSLEQALAAAMAKDPGARFASAQQLALALQRVQAELGLSVTPFEVLGDPDPGPGAADEGGEATRVRQVVSIDPDAGAPQPAGPRAAAPLPGAGQPDDAETLMRGRLPDGGLPGPRAQRRPVADAAEGPAWVPPVPPGSPAAEAPRQRFPTALVAGIGALAIVGVVGAVVANAVLAPDGEPGRPSSGPVLSQGPADALTGLEGSVPQPTGFTATPAGEGVLVAWTNPDPQRGDTYRWAPVTVTETGEYRTVEEPEARVPASGEGPVCVEVYTVRASGAASEPARYCAGD